MRVARMFGFTALSLLTLAAAPAWSAAGTLTAQSHVIDSPSSDLGAVAERLRAAQAQARTIPKPALTLSARDVQQAQLRSARAARQTSFSAAAVAPPVAGCYDIDLNAAYNAPTAPAGQLDCFEFVAPDVTKLVAYVVNLPAGEEHDALLVQVNADGSLTTLDSQVDTATNKVVEAIPGGPVRVLLLVQAKQGAGGSTFQFQVLGTTGYDSYEPNDSPRHATKLSGGQSINANLDSVNDVDYYALQTPAAQTATAITFAGTGTQTAALETQPGTWATLASNTRYTVNSSAGATLMLRVSNTGTTAPAAQPYTLRAVDGKSTAGINLVRDNENITNLVKGKLNSARTITIGVAAWDTTGNIPLPPGEHVTIQAYDRDLNNNKVLLAQASGYTGPSGSFVADLNIGECKSGGIAGPQTFSTLSVPSDWWSITWNPNAFVVAYTDSTEIRDTSSIIYFYHICAETYLGRH
ncbi:hypothetical protein [Burkholderia alba]|uniref:hypothetical protein n=1 Tax=Burkholderia alba TaxID=2683677 RepID=UPI002B05C4F9|nr:hypothetical protein [Burkholderia alba]